MRIFPTIPALFALLAGACTGRQPPSFRTEEVTQGEVVENVSATGEVGAIKTVTVGTQVSGTVLHLYADFNSIVRQGQLLAELDPRLLRAALERAQAGLASAEADVEKAKVTLANSERTRERTEQLVAKNLVAQADLDAALADRDGARAGLKGAQARLLQARADRDTAGTNLSLARITSPIDGIVISRNVDVGQTVAAALAAPTIFTIANDLTRMQILANVDEADIGKVLPGLEAHFAVDAFPGEPFTGHIREVRPAPTTIQNVVTYAAVIDAPNPDHKLRQGMTAAVTIITSRRDDVVRLPNAALRFKPEPGADAKPDGAPSKKGGRKDVAKKDGDKAEHPKGDHPTDHQKLAQNKDDTSISVAGAPAPNVRHGTVYRLENGQPVPVDVTLGLSDGHQTEVLSGIAVGDRVVVGEGHGGTAAPGGSGGPRRGLF